MSAGGPVGGRLALLGRMIADPPAARAGFAAATPEQAAALTALARAHGVEAWLVSAVPDTDAWHEAREQRARFIAARARAVGELRTIDATLGGIGCEWVALKGQVLAEDVYPRPHLRFGVDTDVLVLPSRFQEAIVALVDAGWRLLDGNWPLIARTVPGELQLRSPNGGLLDLHWHLLAGRELRQRFRLPTAELLARRRVLDSGLPALDPADQLVHLGVHGALSGATRLSWLVDAGLAASSGVDLMAVTVRARAAGAGTALATVLLRAARWLGTPAPDDVLEAMGAGSVWRTACRLVDRISPLGPRPDAPGLARAFARSARPGAAASLGELARHGGSWLTSGAARTRADSPLRHPDDARSPLHQADDPRARARYFAAVSATG